MEPDLQPELFKIIYWTALNKNQLMFYYLEVLLTVTLLTEPECYYHPIISMVRTNFLGYAYLWAPSKTCHWYLLLSVIVVSMILGKLMDKVIETNNNKIFF